MLGHDKNKGNKVPKTVFELEERLKKNPKEKEALIKRMEEHQVKLKALLREGQNKKAFEHVGMVLQGFTAAAKILKRI